MRRKNKKLRGRTRSQWEIERERCRISERYPEAGVEDAEEIAAVLRQVIERMVPLRSDWIETLSAEWPRIAGGSVAAHTRPGRLDGRKLFVYVDSAVWLHELKRFGKGQLLNKIQAHAGVGKVTDVVLVPDPNDPHSG